ncbi:MAG: hypothetical protein IJP34_06490 [Clostridia bacterium]|nr:hypothetical protein [Clostridia bacterium]
MKNLKISSLLDVYGEFLSEKQRIVTEHYYNDDLSLSEIAENEGITRQAVCDLIKRAEAQLLIFEEKCGYLEKFSRLKELSSNFDDSKKTELFEIIENL